MSSLKSIIAELKSQSRPNQLEGMARFGISIDNRLGISMPVLRNMGKAIGKNHKLALELWETGIDEARILAALVGEPFELTSAQMETWVSGFNSWDVCDQVCMNLFDKTPLAFKKIIQWSKREEEYVKRAAFTLIACVTLHHKELTDKDLTAFFPLIKKGALDERNYVKKAVNWALRHIGKKNLFLNKSALTFSRELLTLDSRAAKWVARGAIRELESTAVQKRLQKG